VNDTRACVIRRVAPMKSAPGAEHHVDRLQQPEQHERGRHRQQRQRGRVFLRNRFARTNPVLVISADSRIRPRPPAPPAGPCRDGGSGSRTRPRAGRA
jgi:hypothetical protein